MSIQKIRINIGGPQNKKSKESIHVLPRYGQKKYRNIDKTGQKQGLDRKLQADILVAG